MPRYGPGIKYAKIWSGNQICQDMVRGSNMPRYGPGIKYAKIWSGDQICQDMVRGSNILYQILLINAPMFRAGRVKNKISFYLAQKKIRK